MFRIKNQRNGEKVESLYGQKSLLKNIRNNLKIATGEKLQRLMLSQMMNKLNNRNLNSRRRSRKVISISLLQNKE